jgi:hypothetical protein
LQIVAEVIDKILTTTFDSLQQRHENSSIHASDVASQLFDDCGTEYANSELAELEGANLKVGTFFNNLEPAAQIDNLKLRIKFLEE